MVVKTADGLRYASFFKGKQYAIIYDDLDWKNENMSREGMLHLLSGEVTTTSNIKHSTVLVPKETYRALTSNYSLHTTSQFQQEEQQTKGAITCFNRRLHEIQLNSMSLKERKHDNVSASILLKVI